MINAYTRLVCARSATRLVLATPVLALLAASPARAATITVNAGGDFQAALNAAQPGDEIVLAAGATFRGSFVLPQKPSGPVITIRSSASLPNRRITPGDASLLATIGSPNVEPAIYSGGAKNWKFDGIRLLPTYEGNYNVVWLDTGSANITFDRILFEGDPVYGQRRVILGNGANITLTRSYFHNVFRRGDESNAFGAWIGPGPVTITDNFFEVAGINILIGGADSPSADMIVSDVLVEGNHLTKRLAWKSGGSFPATVKNLFEIKTGRRITVRNNLMERNWTDAQNGHSILITTHNDGGNSPWSRIEDVLFERNVIRDVEKGFNILGRGYVYPSGQTTRITIRHNLLIAQFNAFSLGGEAGVVTFDHNTFVTNALGLIYSGGVWRNGEPAVDWTADYAAESFTFTNNLAYHGEGGLHGDSVGSGTVALTTYTRTHRWTHNVMANRLGGQAFPEVTWYPTKAEHEAEFNGDYTLKTTSKYRNAGVDGQDLGAALAGGSITTTAAPPPPRNVRIVR